MEYYPGLTTAKVRSALPFGADMVKLILDGLRLIGLQTECGTHLASSGRDVISRNMPLSSAMAN